MKNTLEFNPTTTKIKMITEWNDEQFKQMKKAIAKHFKGKITTCFSGRGFNHYEFKTYWGIDEIFGLAYTSSGMYACLGVCNCQPCFDADRIYSYSYFTIGEDRTCYAILQDDEENELCIKL